MSTADLPAHDGFRPRSEAEDAYERALPLDPGNAEAHQEFAEYLDYVGRLDEA